MFDRLAMGSLHQLASRNLIPKPESMLVEEMQVYLKGRKGKNNYGWTRKFLKRYSFHLDGNGEYLSHSLPPAMLEGFLQHMAKSLRARKKSLAKKKPRLYAWFASRLLI